MEVAVGLIRRVRTKAVVLVTFVDTTNSAVEPNWGNIAFKGPSLSWSTEFGATVGFYITASCNLNGLVTGYATVGPEAKFTLSYPGASWSVSTDPPEDSPCPSNELYFKGEYDTIIRVGVDILSLVIPNIITINLIPGVSMQWQLTPWQVIPAQYCSTCAGVCLGAGNPVGARKYLGCYEDPAGVPNWSLMVNGAPYYTSSGTMTPEFCAAFCSSFPYFGVQYGSYCFCGQYMAPVQVCFRFFSSRDFFFLTFPKLSSALIRSVIWSVLEMISNGVAQAIATLFGNEPSLIPFWVAGLIMLTLGTTISKWAVYSLTCKVSLTLMFFFFALTFLSRGFLMFP